MALKCWIRFLRAAWTARRSNQSILKEIGLVYSLEGLMLKLKLQYFGHLMQRANSLETRPWCWERLKAGEEEGDRGWDVWMAWAIQWTWTWANSRRWWGSGKPGVLQSTGSQRVRCDLVIEQQSNSVHWQPVLHSTHEGVSWSRQWVKDQKLNQNSHCP